MPQKLGQHFLKNPAILKKIAEIINLETSGLVIEIGPGHGELTEVIGDRFQVLDFKLIAIEKDERLVRVLRNKFGGEKKIEIVRGDALKILPDVFENKKEIFLVGNIPYYITGHLLKIISEAKNKPKRCVLMIQKEVAERITSQPPKMNRLAAITQFWGEPKIAMEVLKNNFSPAPKVDSAVISIERRPRLTERNLGLNYQTVKHLFQQPRKTVLNNLADWIKKDKTSIQIIFEPLKQLLLLRPQNLKITDIEKISEIVNSQLNIYN